IEDVAILRVGVIAGRIANTRAVAGFAHASHSDVYLRTSFAHRIRSGAELEHRAWTKDGRVARPGRADNKVVDGPVRILAAVDHSPVRSRVAWGRRRTLPFEA